MASHPKEKGGARQRALARDSVAASLSSSSAGPPGCQHAGLEQMPKAGGGVKQSLGLKRKATAPVPIGPALEEQAHAEAAYHQHVVQLYIRNKVSTLGTKIGANLATNAGAKIVEDLAKASQAKHAQRPLMRALRKDCQARLYTMPMCRSPTQIRCRLALRWRFRSSCHMSSCPSF
jgi:hypothetical protein